MKLAVNPQRLRFVSVISSHRKYNNNQSKFGFAPLQNNEKWIDVKGFNKIR